MIGLLAKKVGMSQTITNDGEAVAVTLLKVDPNLITQIKSQDSDGYNAIQLGTGSRRQPNRPGKGHLKGLAADKLKELRVDDISKFKHGDKLDVTLFSAGDKVVVTGTSKGKGFAGTVKRHHFSRGPETHGHDHHRQPGSIGAMGMPRVHKGKRMAGRMGGEKVTVKGLKVISVDAKDQVIQVSGNVPGSNKSWVFIKKHE